MACRNLEACEQARTELLSSTGAAPHACVCSRVDLEDFASVRSFAASQREVLRKDGSRTLDVLVNNAGVMNVADGPNGEDRHLKANHYGPFLLTCLLIPSMGPGGRIVNVASRAHYRGQLHFDEAGDVSRHPSWWFSKYARSKLANVSFTQELQRRVKSRGISAYSTSPGPVNTSLFRDFPWYTQWLLKPLTTAVFRTPEQGARSSLYAATSPDLPQGRDVLFIHDDKEMEASTMARDPGMALKLWSASEKWVRLGQHPEDKGCNLSEPH